MRPFGIAGIQQHVSARDDNTDGMVQRLEAMLTFAPWVQMVVFSELAPLGPSPARALPFPNPIEERFCALAKQHRVWLVPGSMFEKDGGKVYNTASVIDPSGVVVGRYRKMFPFAPYEEGVDGGRDPLVFDVPQVGRFGVSICYDMWFPETSRTLAALGAEVIVHPTMTPTVDRDVELSIARATAAQQQCYFVDVNGLGAGGIGRSIVVGPHGDVLHEAGSGEAMFPLELDLDAVRRSREAGLRNLGQPLKSFRDRRADFPVYGVDWQHQDYLEGLGPVRKPGRPVPGRGT